jgi:hypothetical protein
MKRKESARYIVGYGVAPKFVWGKNAEDGRGQGIDTMSLKQAAKEAGDLYGGGKDRVVYKLVPVKNFGHLRKAKVN